MGQARGLEMPTNGPSILDAPCVRSGRGMPALGTDQHAIPGLGWQPRLPYPYCPKTGQALSSPGRNQTCVPQEY